MRAHTRACACAAATKPWGQRAGRETTTPENQRKTQLVPRSWAVSGGVRAGGSVQHRPGECAGHFRKHNSQKSAIKPKPAKPRSKPKSRQKAKSHKELKIPPGPPKGQIHPPSTIPPKEPSPTIFHQHAKSRHTAAKPAKPYHQAPHHKMQPTGQVPPKCRHTRSPPPRASCHHPPDSRSPARSAARSPARPELHQRKTPQRSDSQTHVPCTSCAHCARPVT